MMASDSIFALSSGRGRSGVAVVRLSGPASRHALAGLVGDLPLARTATLRRIRGHDGEIIDQALVLWFPKPNSATGEDVAEFHIHGNPVIAERLMAELGALDGCRPAVAGEFSRRAFEHGKMDLVELEGLADLLAAESEVQRRLAMKQFMGEASAAYEGWRTAVVESLAFVEASIDFADEEGVAELAVQKVRGVLGSLRAELGRALAGADGASAVRRGLSVIIAGAPNSGKSTLMNALVGRDVAIVSPHAGTTRDVVSEPLMVEGLTVRLADTAGLRAFTTDEIERLGMERSRAEIGAADVLVWLEAADGDAEVLPPRAPDILVLSKADLAPPDLIRSRKDHLAICGISRDGLNLLRDRLGAVVAQRIAMAGDGTMVRQRHVEAVRRALQHIDAALAADHGNLEILAEDMRKAAAALALITGKVDVEDWLGRIYAEFCIGK